MAVPSLPADQSAGGTGTAAFINSMLDLQQWWRDTRPFFRGAGAGHATLADATFVELGHGTSSATFLNTPITNTGTFTVASTLNADGQYNIEVPEAGHYEGFWMVQFGQHATGRRRVEAYLNGAALSNLSVATCPAVNGDATYLNVPFEVDCASGDELSCRVYQNSGGTLVVQNYLFVKWVQST